MEGLGIDAKELVKSYGGKRVVDRLTLQVPQGCIFGLLGPNGAGKSTTIGMITGLLKPDEGQVSILGRPMHANALDVRRLVGVVPDNLGLFEHLSIWEHFDIMREVWGIDKVEFMRRVDDLLELLLWNAEENFPSHGVDSQPEGANSR